MKFYKYIFLIIIILRERQTEGKPKLYVSKAGLETPSPLSVGLIFFITINNTSHETDYDVDVTPDECCLNDDERSDCDYLNILGGCTAFVAKGNIKTLRVVAPILDAYERNGHCTMFIDSKSSNGLNERDTIKINFDTRIKNSEFDVGKEFKPCKNKDEDPFNGCKPVNCDTYYNSKRPYFSRKYKRCIEVPPCVSDDSEYPAVIYNPINNQCDKESINERDLEIVEGLSKQNGKQRKVKDVLIISKFQPNITEYVNTVDLLDNLLITTSKPLKPVKYHVKNNCLRSFWKRYFINNKWTFIALSSVITVQCFLICTMFYCLSKTCNCFEDKKVVRKFFNYRQDASVTTPLIGTSNIDTETDYTYLSEASNNVEQKIKSYKSCQKENNLKISMSDDILSKCLNRRDWKKFKSDATEVNKDADINKVLDNADNKYTDYSKIRRIEKFSETSIAFEDEVKNTDKNKTKTVSIVSNAEIINNDISDVEADIHSEKEIKCHSYNCFDISELKLMRNKDFAKSKAEKPKNHAPSVSTEKCAQVYFSNDSIDDFLSERGVTFLAGENISKYTFSSDPNDIKASATSTASSKTSKNFVKNVLSLLRKRSKIGSSSDPGQKEETDVKLIHMSKASVYTSSVDSDYVGTLKRNDSRTSF